jgi:signal transduction histidine kinase
MVQLFQNKGKLILMVEDDGVGIDPKKSVDGHGLLNIQSRLNPLNGEVNFERGPQGGTLVTARIPLT